MTPPDSLQPAHDQLRVIWHKIAEEEERVQELIRNTPDPDSGINPEREEMIRTFQIVRAHRRYTRSCIDVLNWGDPVTNLALPQDKEKAKHATEAAEAFEAALVSAHEDLSSRLYLLCANRDNYNSAALAEDIKAIIRNFTYAFHSARSDLRKSR
jgi:hypothetical protein